MEEFLEVAALGVLNDQDVEMGIIHNILNHGQNGIGNRQEIYGLFSLEEMPEEVWLNFRCKKGDIPRLAVGLGMPEYIRAPLGYTCSGIQGLCILLRRLSYPNRWSDLEPLFGLSNKSLSNIGNHMMQLIFNNKGMLLSDLEELHWLNYNKMKMYAEAIVERGAPVGNCWGFINGTARAICRPIIDQENYYSGHKRFHSQKKCYSPLKQKSLN